MNDRLDLLPLAATRPELPTPVLARWQPLRLGLVELFHYDSEEFWFRDGHLLLRGNNGTGKSKVLSLTLPFLFDAQLKPSRIEPDGDPGKKMAWNLLMNGYDRRIGYAWIELGRLGEDGRPRYLTLGAGLSAAAARPGVESWFFIVEGRDGEPGPRIGQDLWLTTPQRVVLTRERLRDALQDRGQVFDTAAVYRRAVDERLFRLGPARYAALMDTLIQLRQPQLSKKPDESSLSNALTEALPPLAKELLGDVADALGQLEEDRRQLDEYEALAQAVGRFDQRYRVYAGVQSRRQARVLRQAQTDFDNASRALGEAQQRLQAALEEETLSIAAREEAELERARQRAKLETLRSDPTMQDANRLEEAARVAAARQRDAEDAGHRLAEVQQRLQRAETETRQCAQRVSQAGRALDEARREAVEHAEAAGVKSRCADNALVALDRADLVELPPRAFDAAQAELRALATTRREQIALLRQRHAERARAESLEAQRRQGLDERLEDAEAAAERRAQADAGVESAGQALVRAWEAHFAGLRQLQLDTEAPLAALADWVVSLAGDNPAAQALQAAQQQASRRLAARRVALEGQRQALRDEAQALEQERARLAAGEDAEPPCPYTRGTDTRGHRPGAPLWQLIEFRDSVDAAQRAGLEAALEAAGLLDAWVSPDGRMQTADDRTPLHDTQALPRPAWSPASGSSLADWLQAAAVPDAPVPADTVARLLAGIACGMQDPADREAWIAPDGRFRLGALVGAWRKPAAVHIGFAARAAARERRIAEIAQRLRELAAELAALQAQLERQLQDEREAEEEWRGAPADDALRHAHLAASSCAAAWRTARERLAQAEAQHREAQQAVEAARRRLADDAADLQLPEAAEALPAVETALEHFNDAQHQLAQAARELRLALPELRRQELREAEARHDRQQGEERDTACRIEAEDSRARLEVLREAVGARVGELQQQLAEAVRGVKASEDAHRAAESRLREAGEARAVAATQAGVAETALQERSEARTQAVARLQSFAATGLLSAALPGLELPELHSPWTIDPALTLARSAEQLLKDVEADDPSWERVQKQIAGDFTELQRALTALGHQAQAESSDYGLVVGIVYQNRPQRPDQLAARLADEITQRSELLTANEREVLENHLQAEIATEVQRLLQAAERQVEAINRELHKRPTTTGVRFRLQWLPLAEGADGAPVGLEAARKRLLNTAADLWSAEDRRVVGAMLQQRIAAERSRADAGPGRDGGGSLLDQLARALDYRRWHEFRVQRWQDGQWRRLSGPASSGERALGLTVPLFAAVASFYDSQGGWAQAPRLVLLDEAFAGIDDAARAHCMALIREFELDFVITSEREWGCYAELPGVSICQLQRREGIDAVFVSRWSWDGRAKQRESDPDRRFAPAA